MAAAEKAATRRATTGRAALSGRAEWAATVAIAEKTVDSSRRCSSKGGNDGGSSS